MIKQKSIKAINLPPKLPIHSTIITWLALDHWGAPSWAYAVAITIGVLWWIGCILIIVNREYVDIFEQKP